jgi:hypothetical protein
VSPTRLTEPATVPPIAQVQQRIGYDKGRNGQGMGAKRGSYLRIIKPSIQYFAGFNEVLKADPIDHCNPSRPRLLQLGWTRVSSRN